MTIVEALHDSRFFLPVFKDIRTWHSWEIYLRALFGLGIDNPEDLKLFQECTGLIEPPKERVKESYCVCGRRAGKSFTSALIAAFIACFQNWKQILSAGERGMIFILSVDKFQSRIIRDYVSVILNSSESFKKLIKRETPEEVELKNQVSICVKAASFRSLRGFELLACLCDEVAFWQDLETGANPAAEILRAVRPGLMNTGGLLLAISTPYSRAGVLYQAYKDYFGKTSGPLIWKSPSLVMNPTLSKDQIEAELSADPEGGASEWLSEFRSDVSAFLPSELVEAAVVPGRYELPYMKNFRYFAHADPSGGRSDSFTLAIAHKESNEKIILDIVEERKPPFSPENVVEEFSAVLKNFGLSQVSGDSYSASWCSDSFRKNGVFYMPSEKSASELYLQLLPLLASGKVELLDSKRLRGQLSNLERRVRPGGHDLVTHGPSMHDDCANAAAGSLVLAASEPQRDGLPSFSFGHESAVNAESLEERRERAWLLDKAFLPTEAEKELLEDEKLEKKLLEELEEEAGK